MPLRLSALLAARSASPTGLLPLGDSICRFNPIYGQGMSVAAQEAFALYRLLNSRRALGDPLVGLSGDFFEGAFPLIDAHWAIAASLDFVYPQTRGQRPVEADCVAVGSLPPA
jgi:hypothetical protein